MGCSSSTAILTALALGAVTPAFAQGGDRIAELEAKLSAQEARIRALEEQLAAVRVPPEPAKAPQASAEVRPPSNAFPTLKVRGRLQVDALLLAEPGARATGTQVRRFYLGAQGQLAPKLRFQAEADLAGNRVSLQDAILVYAAGPDTDVIGGYFKPFNTADELTSDVSTLFLERSAFANSFAPGRRIGLGVSHMEGRIGLQGGLFGEREDVSLDVDRREGWLASGRIYADLLPGDDALHVAASAYRGRIGSEANASLSIRPESNRAPSVLQTGSFEAEHSSFLGAELGYGSGPLTIQAEGGLLRYPGAAAEPDFWGFSAQLAWRLTGEPRPYLPRNGIFGRVSPAGRLGAFEAGLRFTHVDVQDGAFLGGPILGGHLTTYGAVLNWYPLTNIRVAGNLIHARTSLLNGETESQNLLTLRGGIDW